MTPTPRRLAAAATLALALVALPSAAHAVPGAVATPPAPPAPPRGPGSIVVVPPPPAFTLELVDDPEAWEGDLGDARTLDLVVLASTAAPEAVTVRVVTAIVGDSAEAGADYEPVDQVVELPAGTTSVVVEVPIVGDDLDEADELLLAHLEAPSLGAVAFDGTTVVARILDDDGPGEGPGRPAPGPGDLASRGGAGSTGPGGYQSSSRSARSAAFTA